MVKKPAPRKATGNEAQATKKKPTATKPLAKKNPTSKKPPAKKSPKAPAKKVVKKKKTVAPQKPAPKTKTGAPQKPAPKKAPVVKKAPVGPDLSRRKKKTMPDVVVHRTAAQIKAEATRKREERLAVIAAKAELRQKEAARKRAEREAEAARKRAEREAAAARKLKERQDEAARKLEERERSAAEKARIAARAREDAARRKQEAQAEREAEATRKQAERERLVEEERARKSAEAERQRQLRVIARTIAQAEKEANRITAAQLAAEERERRERHKAAEQAEKQAAREAAARAKVDAANARIELKQRARTLTQTLDQFDKSEREQQGATTVELLEWFIRVFSLRPDVRIEKNERGAPLGEEDLLALALAAEGASTDAAGAAASSEPASVPAAAAFATLRRGGPTHFRWAMATEEQDLGGEFFLAPPPSVVALASDWERGGADWSTAWRERARGFFAAPARRDAVRAELTRTSLARTTPSPTILNLLTARGASPREAKLLGEWLGDDVFSLFEESATPEGHRRSELRARARELSQSDPSTPLVELIGQWNSGPVLDKSIWTRVLAAHRAFLDAGGGGGRFVVSMEDGLPRARYQKAHFISGQAVVPLENLSGLKCAGVRLAFADLTGIRAEKGNFARSDLEGSSLSFARLAGANFQGAQLRGANFTSARLAEADFRKADLTDAHFERADLRGAQFAGAITTGTRFTAADVRGIKY